MYQFKLPDVGEGIHEAEILKWLVAEGDTVAVNQPILEIQTDKAVVEIPSPVAGTVQEIKARPGNLAQVGDVLITIATGEKQPEKSTKSSNGQQTPPPMKASVGIGGPGQRVLAAPAVRKMALEMGVDLSNVSGSGPAGRVLPEDLKNYVAQQKATPQEAPANAEAATEAEPPARPAAEPAKAPPSTPPPGQEGVEEEPLQGLRRRIVQRMELAWEIPHVTSFQEVEVSKLVALRRELQPAVL